MYTDFELLSCIFQTPSDKCLDKVTEANSVPAVVIQFLEFIYSNVKSFTAICLEKKFLQFLAATLYPLESNEEAEVCLS